MRELPQRHRPLLEGRSIVMASADRVLISGLVHSLDGIGSLVGAAKAQQPSLRCLMMIQRPVLSTFHAAAKAQCEGLCSHERISNGGVLSVLRAMKSDGSHMDPVISGVANHDRCCKGAAHRLSDVLSLREEDVLRGLCKGLSNQEIADQLHLSIETTKHCVTGLLRKLDAKSRTQAVLIAFQRNLVDPPLPIPRWAPQPE